MVAALESSPSSPAPSSTSVRTFLHSYKVHRLTSLPFADTKSQEQAASGPALPPSPAVDRSPSASTSAPYTPVFDVDDEEREKKGNRVF